MLLKCRYEIDINSITTETAKQLELVVNLESGKKENTLFSFFEKTRTKQGSIIFIKNSFFMRLYSYNIIDI